MAEENSRIELTEEQNKFNMEVRQIYNSGRMREAYEMSLERYQQNAEDLFYKYKYAVMAGDYSFDDSLMPEKAQELLEIAKKIIREVYFNKNRDRYDPKFVRTFKNEYFFFHELHDEQYKLGEDTVKDGEKRGFYSMCIGATELAKKHLKNGNVDEAISWATKAIDAFNEFEKVDPNWYNINYFGSEALAILGRNEEAVEVYKGLYMKQKQNVDEKALAKFVQSLAGFNLNPIKNRDQ